MKKFPFVPDQITLLPDSTPALKPDGTEQVWTQFSFLAHRVADTGFAGARPGLEALRFAMATQIALSEQREAANERGYWLLEDEPADALQKVTRNPAQPYNATFVLTLIHFVEALEKLEPYKEASA